MNKSFEFSEDAKTLGDKLKSMVEIADSAKRTLWLEEDRSLCNPELVMKNVLSDMCLYIGEKLIEGVDNNNYKFFMDFISIDSELYKDLERDLPYIIELEHVRLMVENRKLDYVVLEHMLLPFRHLFVLELSKRVREYLISEGVNVKLDYRNTDGKSIDLEDRDGYFRLTVEVSRWV